MTTENTDTPLKADCSSAPCSALFVNVPPILELRDYVTAHGYGVTARFDFTDVPAKYHGDMLMLIRLGGYHLARPASDPPKPQPPAKRWWHKFLPNDQVSNRGSENEH